MRTKLTIGVALSLCVVASSANAATILFSNGAVNDLSESGACDSGPGACGGSGTWWYYDNFTIGAASTMTGFDVTDGFPSGGPADYVSTDWQVWDADPFTAAGPIASGSAVAVISTAGIFHRFDVTGLSVALNPGTTYWLGVNHVLTSPAVSAIATAVGAGGALVGSKQSDLGTNDSNIRFLDRAFTIYGQDATVPEPTTLALLGSALAIAAGRRLSRRKS